MIGGNLAGFALEIGAEVDDLVAGVAGELDRGVERSLRPRDQLEMRPRESLVAWLAAFVPGVIERMAYRIVDFKTVFGDKRTCIGKRGGIRHRRPGGDRGWVVMRNVGDRQRHDLGASSGPCEPAALDPRQVLANGIDLADRRAGA